LVGVAVGKGGERGRSGEEGRKEEEVEGR